MGSHKYFGQVGDRSNVAVCADLKAVWEELLQTARRVRKNFYRRLNMHTQSKMVVPSEEMRRWRSPTR
jgi:hypothetical protein